MTRRHSRLLFISVVLLFSAFSRAQDHAVVIVPVANMYSSASDDADVATLESRGDWAKIRTPDQYTGWIQLSTVRKLNGSGDYGSSTPTVQVNSLSANLYRETDVTAHKPVITAPFESRLELIGDATADDGRWLKVRLPDLGTAWIQSGDIIRDPKPLTIAESIDLAKRFLGITYLWGGRSSFGYDCSGFTQMLVRSRGINMPRDADLQAAWEGVVAIDRKDLQAGDLLFFGSSPASITHTGMFIGGGEFIHDTVHGHPGVQISRLDDQPWTRILVACRRIK